MPRALLDPGNQKSAKKRFYNPNILKEFDPYYEKATTELLHIAPSAVLAAEV
jgi:hypothetical protein